MTAFYLVTFKRKHDTLRVCVVCPTCKKDAPEGLYDATPIDHRGQYTTTVEPIYGVACDECHAEPDALPVCRIEGCSNQAGPLGHPYDRSVCRSCGDKQAMRDGEAAYERLMGRAG